MTLSDQLAKHFVNYVRPGPGKVPVDGYDMWPYLMSPGNTSSPHPWLLLGQWLRIAYHMTSHHITSHHITSHHITSHHITSHHITSHHITSHHITPHHITSHHRHGQRHKRRAYSSRRLQDCYWAADGAVLVGSKLPQSGLFAHVACSKVGGRFKYC